MSTVNQLYNIQIDFPHKNCFNVDLKDLEHKFNFAFNFSLINKREISIDSVRCATGYLYNNLDINILNYIPNKKILLIDSINIINNIYILKIILIMDMNKQFTLKELDRYIILYKMYYIRNKKNKRDNEHTKILQDEEITRMLSTWDEIQLFAEIQKYIQKSKIENDFKKKFSNKTHETIHGFSTQINFYLIAYLLPIFLNHCITDYQIYIIMPHYSGFSSVMTNIIKNISSNKSNIIHFISVPCYQNTQAEIECIKNDSDDFIIIYLYYFFSRKMGITYNQFNDTEMMNSNIIIWSYDSYLWYGEELKVLNMHFFYNRISGLYNLYPYNKLTYSETLSEMPMDILVDLNPDTRGTKRTKRTKEIIGTNIIAATNTIFGNIKYENVLDELLDYYKINFGSRQNRFINGANYLWDNRISITDNNNSNNIVIDATNLFLNLNFLNKLIQYNKLFERQRKFLTDRIEIFKQTQIDKDKLLNDYDLNIFIYILEHLVIDLFTESNIFIIARFQSRLYRKNNGNNNITIICVDDMSTDFDSYANGNVTFVTFFIYYYLLKKNPKTILWSYNSFDYDWIDIGIICKNLNETYKLVVTDDVLPKSNLQLQIVNIPTYAKPKECHRLDVPCILSNINSQFCTYFNILK